MSEVTSGKSAGAAGSEQTLSPRQFESYREKLVKLLTAYAKDRAEHARDVDAALDGQPGRTLRQLYAPHLLRATGTFFTGSGLATRLIEHLELDPPPPHLIVDPACGAGDLLIACAKRLPIRTTVKATLKDWGRQLVGFDTNYAFIEAARLRIGLLALQRVGGSTKAIDLDFGKLLPNIRAADGMADWNLGQPISLVVVNPPFAHINLGPKGRWARGRTSQAAFFIERCLKESCDGTQLAAVLPDVLRTGSRYQSWRDLVQRTSQNLSTTVVGRFDKSTDVDVFLLKLTVGKADTSHNWSYPRVDADTTLRDVFEIRVGPVVPFRLNGNGDCYPYAHAGVLPSWGTTSDFTERIHFEGRVYKPPFVLVRRTSKPDYKQRCVATIVTGEQHVAVENHLIVLQPKDGSFSSCEMLLNLLKRPSTTAWMNNRIRCRHLTVQAISELPWEDVL